MRFTAILAGSLALTIAQCALGVTLSQDNTGQVLIYPYYTVQGSNDTLFSIANPLVGVSQRYKAIKVRFHEARDSRTVLDFNLYLAPGMVFTAMVTQDASGNPVLRSQSPACTAPVFPPSTAMPGWTEVALTNANYVDYDKAGGGLDRAREGYFEAIEMGEVLFGFQVAANWYFGGAITYANLSAPTGTQNCAVVANAWASGGAFLVSGGSELTAPAGGLFGMGMIINVPQGTDYSYDPVVLANVYSTAHHAAPGSASPSLDDADPVSTVLAGNAFRTSTWTRGSDAVSAVLMHQTVKNEYIRSTPTLQAASDIVLTFPTRQFYVARQSDTGQSTRAPFQSPFNDVNVADGQSVGACEAIAMWRYTTDGRENAVPLSYGLPTTLPRNPSSVCWATTILHLGNVLSSQIATPVVGDGPTTFGWFNIDFGTDAPLTSIEGHKYFGLPVVGFVAEEYVNGNLNGVLANYSGVLIHKYVNVVQ